MFHKKHQADLKFRYPAKPQGRPYSAQKGCGLPNKGPPAKIAPAAS